MEANTAYNIKIVVIGSSSCGKTALCNSLLGKPFGHNKYSSIDDIGVETVSRNDRQIKLEIHDTAGEERYSSVAPQFYRNAHVIIICYDITRKETYDKVGFWSSQKGIPDTAIFFLIGCKKDLEERREIELTWGREIANTLSETQAEVKCFETSAKENYNIEKLKDLIITEVFENFKLVDLEQRTIITEQRIVSLSQPTTNSSRCWCRW